jgi:predicted membrane-bound spermidine synthase
VRLRVTRRRDGLQLRVDGSLASLQSPDSALTGTVWWALAAGVVFAPASRRRRVLVLGLAAGSVAGALRALDPDAEVVGVEHDREILALARRHFGMNRLGLEVVAGDAFRYLRAERRRFDLVVEDLFIGPMRSVHKPPELLGDGYRLILERLRPGGVVSSNTIHETPAVIRALRPHRGRIVSLNVRGYWNRILFCGRELPPAPELRRRLKRHGAFEGLLSKITVTER